MWQQYYSNIQFLPRRIKCKHLYYNVWTIIFLLTAHALKQQIQNENNHDTIKLNVWIGCQTLVELTLNSIELSSTWQMRNAWSMPETSMSWFSIQKKNKPRPIFASPIAERAFCVLNSSSFCLTRHLVHTYSKKELLWCTEQLYGLYLKKSLKRECWVD